MFYLLHISDLHRSLTEPFNNDALLASLISDAARYLMESPSIPCIDAIVVSGDIIQGLALQAASVDSGIWQTELTRQYDAAYEFLGQLADRFLGGNRSQLVMVPGNHDVCWNTAYRSMARVLPDDLPGGVLKSLSERDSRYRWSWAELAPYKIFDMARYDQRLDSYWAFVERFYAGASLVRPINRSAGYNLFEIDKGRILVAAFDSVACNDCFSFCGDFSRDAVARCAIELHDLGRVHDLRMAVWHHNIDGPPNSQDYMDVGRVHEMIGHGFRLGLHGHQHVAAANAHYIHLPESQAMAVVSAGSLCAGARELPRGVDRQYNLVLLDDERTSARVIVRQMSESGHFARKTDGRFAANGSISLRWERPLDLGGRPLDSSSLRLRRAIESAEWLRADAKLLDALDALDGLEFPPGSYQRSLAIALASDSDRPDRMLQILDAPTNAEELVHFVMASIRERKPAQAEEALMMPIASNLAPSVLLDLQNRITTFRALNR